MRFANWKRAASALLLAASPAFAAEAPRRQEDPKIRKGPVYTTEQSAPRDYHIQGEYVSADKKHGLQVLSRLERDTGAVTFRAIIFPGGLPGEGWDGKRKLELPMTSDGAGNVRSDNGVIAIAPDGSSATITDPGGPKIELREIKRQSPTLGAKPPAGATILFDGSSVDAWQPGKMNDQKLLMVPASTKQKFTDFTAHIEFILPYMPQAQGQDRGNSGVYPQGRYEIQVLDSFGLKGENNECGGIYRTAAPKVNMCFPPLVWQTYDIDFTAPKYEGDKKVSNAKVTIKHNGVTIHENQEIEKETGGGNAGKEGPTPGPLYFQDHGDQVFYRNVWIVEKK